MVSRNTARAAAAQPSPVSTPQVRTTAAAKAPRPLVLAAPLALAASLVVTAGWSSAAHAQAAEGQTGSAPAAQADDVRRYNIPAGPLAEVLTRFSTESGVFLGGATDLAEGKRSPGLQGQYSVEQALRTLLAGSELSYQFAGENRVTLVAAQAGDGPMRLDPIMVGGEAGSGMVEGYKADGAITATKTDTPLLRTPQSVSVVTRDQMDDRQLRRLNEVIRDAPGVVARDAGFRSDFFNLRGFSGNGSTYVDGLQADPSFWVMEETFGMERVEVLRGPASVLYGQSARGPGGIVQLVSKRPLPEPHAEVGAGVTSFGGYEVTADVGTPVFGSERVSVRVPIMFRHEDSHIDFVEKDRFFIQPTVAFDITPDTRLTLITSYLRDDDFVKNDGLPAEGTVLPNPNGDIPIDRFTGEPDFEGFTIDQYRLGYALEHSFSDDWSLRHNVRANFFEWDGNVTFNTGFEPNLRDLNRFASIQDQEQRSVGSDLQLQGALSTGPVEHTVLFGIDYFYRDFEQRFGSAEIGTIDVFDPVFTGTGAETFPTFDSTTEDNNIGLYFQDQISLTERLDVVVGGRYDISDQEQTNNQTGVVTQQDDEEFTARAGIVYEVAPGVVPYFSWSESFQPVGGADRNNDPFEPETGEQFELGVKTEFLDGALGWNLSLFHLERQNVTTTDPIDTNFSIQTGEQRSRGVETELVLDLQPWQVTASYAFTDAEITEDNDIEVGNGLRNIPRHSASFWGKYSFSGTLAGFSTGVGVRYVGESEGDLNNTFELPDYTVVDLGLFYERGPWDLQVNVNNLFDEEHFVGSNNRNKVFQGDPVNAEVRVGYRF